ncbi:MAG: hypothetical protein H6727_18720 [Myxococcales bacterium]|nr:hypothetical protein [Myxococcales bacterium]
MLFFEIDPLVVEVAPTTNASLLVILKPPPDRHQKSKMPVFGARDIDRNADLNQMPSVRYDRTIFLTKLWLYLAQTQGIWIFHIAITSFVDLEPALAEQFATNGHSAHPAASTHGCLFSLSLRVGWALATQDPKRLKNMEDPRWRRCIDV